MEFLWGYSCEGHAKQDLVALPTISQPHLQGELGSSDFWTIAQMPQTMPLFCFPCFEPITYKRV